MQPPPMRKVKEFILFSYINEVLLQFNTYAIDRNDIFSCVGSLRYFMNRNIHNIACISLID